MITPRATSATSSRRPRTRPTVSVEPLDGRLLLSAGVLHPGVPIHAEAAEVQLAAHHHHKAHAGIAHPGHHGSSTLTGGGGTKGHGVSTASGGPVPVQVTNSGTVNPVPVVDARTPFERQVSLNSTTSAGTSTTFQVPAGFRLEIDHVNALLFAPGNNAIQDIYISGATLTRYPVDQSPLFAYEYSSNSNALTFDSSNQLVTFGFEATTGSGYGYVTISGFLTPTS